jgi:nucleoside diphosphate kinase
VSQAIEPWLTRDDRKRAVYLDDPYFWEGWASYNAARPPAWELTRLTFLLVKPEAIAGRRVEPILEFVRSAGFLVIGTWPVRMGRHEARNLWRYSLNELPIAHIRALEMLVTAGQLFLVGLGLGRDACLDRVDSRQVTAAERLSRAKGSTSRPEAPGTLRQRLGCPALTLNFVHAPDEPADMLRELAVLGDANLQEQVIARLVAARDWPRERFDAMRGEAAAIMTSQYALCPAHDLDVAATFERMRRRLRDRPLPALGPAIRYAIETGTVSPERGLEVVRSLELATELPMWDRVVTAASLVDDLRTGRRPLVELGTGEQGADRHREARTFHRSVVRCASNSSTRRRASGPSGLPSPRVMKVKMTQECWLSGAETV